MKYNWLDNYLLSKKGVMKDYKAEWNWDRYLLKDKMVAAVCYSDDNIAKFITLKLEPLEGDMLRKKYPDIIPGYYMNKIHWNSIVIEGNVPDDVVKNMLDKSYSLILSGLSKKVQNEIINS